MNIWPRFRTFWLVAFCCAALPAAVSVRLLWWAATIQVRSAAETDAAGAAGAADATAGDTRAAPRTTPRVSPRASGVRRARCMGTPSVDGSGGSPDAADVPIDEPSQPS